MSVAWILFDSKAWSIVSRNKLVPAKRKDEIQFQDLKVGDFVESEDSYLFCFSTTQSDGGSPSCLGRRKTKKEIKKSKFNSLYLRRLENPTKSFIKKCIQLLDINFNKKWISNLDYIEALSVLKNHEKSVIIKSRD